MVRFLVVISIWIILLPVELTMACLFTDIIDGVCVPWSNYSSLAVKKTMVFLVPFVEYLLPLALMVFCYVRLVYSLYHKVPY